MFKNLPIKARLLSAARTSRKIDTIRAYLYWRVILVTHRIALIEGNPKTAFTKAVVKNTKQRDNISHKRLQTKSLKISDKI